MNIDEAVATAISEHWSRQPRVTVRASWWTHSYDRRPFRRGGHWFVRMQGVARLVNPQRNGIMGGIVFDLDWSRP